MVKVYVLFIALAATSQANLLNRRPVARSNVNDEYTFYQKPQSYVISSPVDVPVVVDTEDRIGGYGGAPAGTHAGVGTGGYYGYPVGDHFERPVSSNLIGYVSPDAGAASDGGYAGYHSGYPNANANNGYGG